MMLGLLRNVDCATACCSVLVHLFFRFYVDNKNPTAVGLGCVERMHTDAATVGEKEIWPRSLSRFENERRWIKRWRQSSS